jgi:nucleoid DNA-binding protein
MNKLSNRIAKKMGISKYDADAFLKAIGFEIVECLKDEQRFYYEGFGTFYCIIKPTGLTLRLKLSTEAYNRLNKIEEGERSDEIVFE